MEAQPVSYSLCRRGLRWNLGADGTGAADVVQVSHADLRTWDGGGGGGMRYDLLTGTPPYFPPDRFVPSQNHHQKVRCRVPTRGAAADYVAAAARLLAAAGVFVMVEAAREQAAAAVWAAVARHGLVVARRLDVVTRDGLAPRFSCWVIQRRPSPPPCAATADGGEGSDRQAGGGGARGQQAGGSSSADPDGGSFAVTTLTLRAERTLRRTPEYVAAMEKMGWIDYEGRVDSGRQQLAAATGPTD